MQVATVATLSLLLTVPSLGPGKAPLELESPVSAKDAEEAARQARALLLQRARAVAEPFLKATSPDDLQGLLAEALDDSDLLAKLEAFDQAFQSLVHLVGSQPLEHGTVVRLLGPSFAHHLLSPSALDEAHNEALRLLLEEIEKGVQRPNLVLMMASPEQAGGLPGRVMKLVLDRWKGRLAGATLVAALLGGRAIQEWQADALHEAVEQGKRATLVLLAGLGVPVPENVIPNGERLDLQAAFRQARHPGGRGMSWIEDASSFVAPSPPLEAPSEGALLPTDLTASSWDEPDLDLVEATVRAGLLKQGRDPDDVLRRAARNLQRAEQSQGMTDADVQRAVGWVLGRS